MVDLGQPTLTEVRQWRDQLVGNWGLGGTTGLSGSVSREEALYFQQFDSQVERWRDQKIIKTGSAPSDAEGAIDALVPAQIQVRCRPARRTQAYRDLADKRLRFAQALLHGWRTPKDLLSLIVSDQVIRRCGVGRVLWDQRLWPDRPPAWSSMKPDERTAWDLRYRNRSPITFEVRNPRYTGWHDLQDGTLLAVCEHYPVAAPEAKVLFGRYPQARKILAEFTTPNAEVWVDDVWVGEYRCLMLQDQPLYVGGSFGTARGASAGVVKTLYPEIPYIVFPFRELNFEGPGERYRGMLTNAGDLYVYESEMMGMIQQMVRWNAWKTYIGFFQGGKEEGLVINPGEVIEVKKHMNEYLEMMTGESFPADLLQGIQMYDAFITRNSVAGGAPMPGENRSAQQVWATQSLKQLKLEPARRADQTGLAQALRLATVIGATFLEPNERLTLPLPGRDDDTNEALAEVTIRGSDLVDYPDCYEVSFGARMDPATVEMGKAMAGFAQSNFIDQRRALEMSGMVESAQEVLDDLDIQATENLPFMKALFALRRAKIQWGPDSDEYLMLKDVLGGELQKMVQQAVGGPQPPQLPPGAQQPPPGQQPVPMAPLPGGGAPNPTGMNTPGDLPQAGQQLARNSALGGRQRIAGRVASGRPPGMNAGGGAAGGGSL